MTVIYSATMVFRNLTANILTRLMIAWSLTSLPAAVSARFHPISVRRSVTCFEPSLPFDAFHVVVAGYEYSRNFETHYLWDLGLPNLRILLYRRVDAEKPPRAWTGPCGMIAEEKLLLPNRGRDAAAFYDYAVEHYARPPLAFAVLHGHVAHSWHTSCHAVFTRITRYYAGLASPTSRPNVKGMVTLTSKSQDDPNRDPLDWFGGRKLLTEHSREEAKFKELGVSVKNNGFKSCCGSFITLGSNLKKNDVTAYLKLKEYTIDESLRDDQTARFGYEFIVYGLWDDPASPRVQAEAWYKEADEMAVDALLSKIEKCDRKA